MLTTDPVRQLIADAANAKIPMTEVCRRAGVAASTPSRWNSGQHEPNNRTLKRLGVALAEIVAERSEPDVQPHTEAE